MQLQGNQFLFTILSQQEINMISQIPIEASCNFKIFNNLCKSQNSVEVKSASYLLQIRANYLIQWNSEQNFIIGGYKLKYNIKIKVNTNQTQYSKIKADLTTSKNPQTKSQYELILSNNFKFTNVGQFNGKMEAQNQFCWQLLPLDISVFLEFMKILEKKPILNQIQDLRQLYKAQRCAHTCKFCKIFFASEIFSQHKVAVKSYPKQIFQNSQAFYKVRQWLLLLHRINNSDILTPHKIFCTQNSLYIILQKCETNLSTLLQNKTIKISIATIQKLFFKLLKIIQFLHSHQIIHSNIQPGNILIKKLISPEPQILLTGFSNFKSLDNSQKQIGNPQGQNINQHQMSNSNYNNDWMQKSQQQIDQKYMFCHDVSQIGGIFKSLLNKMELSKTSVYETNQVINEQNKIALELAQDLIQKMTQIPIKQRLTAQEALNHKFFTINLNV